MKSSRSAASPSRPRSGVEPSAEVSRDGGSARARQSNFRAVSVGHLAIDVFNSMGPVLLAQLKLTMGLSIAQVGLAAGLYQLLAGATQPLFGWLVDERGSRRLGPASVAWVIGLVTFAAIFAPSIGYGWFLLLFSVAAIGSGAFHPQGTMHAGVAVEGRAATTTAIFFFCGQIGLSLGPLLAGVTIDRVGMNGIAWLALLLLPVPLWMASRMSGPQARTEPTVAAAHVPRRSHDASESATPVGESGEKDAAASGSGSALVVSQLAAVFGLRAWIFIGTAAFLPVLFQAAGASASRQGLLTGAFWLGGGFSGVVAGALADRVGKRAVGAGSTLLGALLLLVLPDVTGGWALLTTLVCGGLLGAPHSLLMVLAQELLPVRRGLASGYALGFLFSCGAIASWGIGLLAESWPLETVIRWGVVPGIIAAILLVLLPSSNRTRSGQPFEPSEAALN